MTPTLDEIESTPEVLRDYLISQNCCILETVTVADLQVIDMALF